MPSIVESVVLSAFGLLFGAIGWVATRFVGSPLWSYRQLRAEIAGALVHFDRVDALRGARNEPQEQDVVEARRRALELVGKLDACIAMVAFYGLWATMGAVSPPKEIEKVKANLRRLSKMMGYPGQGLDNSARVNEIRKALGI